LFIAGSDAVTSRLLSLEVVVCGGEEELLVRVTQVQHDVQHPLRHLGVTYVEPQVESQVDGRFVATVALALAARTAVARVSVS